MIIKQPQLNHKFDILESLFHPSRKLLQAPEIKFFELIFLIKFLNLT